MLQHPQQVSAYYSTTVAEDIWIELTPLVRFNVSSVCVKQQVIESLEELYLDTFLKNGDVVPFEFRSMLGNRMIFEDPSNIEHLHPIVYFVAGLTRESIHATITNLRHSSSINIIMSKVNSWNEPSKETDQLAKNSFLQFYANFARLCGGTTFLLKLYDLVSGNEVYIVCTLILCTLNSFMCTFEPRAVGNIASEPPHNKIGYLYTEMKKQQLQHIEQKFANLESKTVNSFSIQNFTFPIPTPVPSIKINPNHTESSLLVAGTGSRPNAAPELRITPTSYLHAPLSHPGLNGGFSPLGLSNVTPVITREENIWEKRDSTLNVNTSPDFLSDLWQLPAQLDSKNSSFQNENDPTLEYLEPPSSLGAQNTAVPTCFEHLEEHIIFHVNKNIESQYLKLKYEHALEFYSTSPDVQSDIMLHGIAVPLDESVKLTTATKNEILMEPNPPMLITEPNVINVESSTYSDDKKSLVYSSCYNTELNSDMVPLADHIISENDEENVYDHEKDTASNQILKENTLVVSASRNEATYAENIDPNQSKEAIQVNRKSLTKQKRNKKSAVSLQQESKETLIQKDDLQKKVARTKATTTRIVSPFLLTSQVPEFGSKNDARELNPMDLNIIKKTDSKIVNSKVPTGFVATCSEASLLSSKFIKADIRRESANEYDKTEPILCKIISSPQLSPKPLESAISSHIVNGENTVKSVPNFQSQLPTQDTPLTKHKEVLFNDESELNVSRELDLLERPEKCSSFDRFKKVQDYERGTIKDDQSNGTMEINNAYEKEGRIHTNLEEKKTNILLVNTNNINISELKHYTQTYEFCHKIEETVYPAAENKIDKEIIDQHSIANHGYKRDMIHVGNSPEIESEIQKPYLEDSAKRNNCNVNFKETNEKEDSSISKIMKHKQEVPLCKFEDALDEDKSKFQSSTVAVKEEVAEQIVVNGEEVLDALEKVVGDDEDEVEDQGEDKDEETVSRSGGHPEGNINLCSYKDFKTLSEAKMDDKAPPKTLVSHSLAATNSILLSQLLPPRKECLIGINAFVGSQIKDFNEILKIGTQNPEEIQIEKSINNDSKTSQKVKSSESVFGIDMGLRVIDEKFKNKEIENITVKENKNDIEQPIRRAKGIENGQDENVGDKITHISAGVGTETVLQQEREQKQKEESEEDVEVEEEDDEKENEVDDGESEEDDGESEEKGSIVGVYSNNLKEGMPNFTIKNRKNKKSEKKMKKTKNNNGKILKTNEFQKSSKERTCNLGIKETGLDVLPDADFLLYDNEIYKFIADYKQTIYTRSKILSKGLKQDDLSVKSITKSLGSISDCRNQNRKPFETKTLSSIPMGPSEVKPRMSSLSTEYLDPPAKQLMSEFLIYGLSYLFPKYAIDFYLYHLFKKRDDLIEMELGNKLIKFLKVIPHLEAFIFLEVAKIIVFLNKKKEALSSFKDRDLNILHILFGYYQEIFSTLEGGLLLINIENGERYLAFRKEIFADIDFMDTYSIQHLMNSRSKEVSKALELFENYFDLHPELPEYKPLQVAYTFVFERFNKGNQFQEFSILPNIVLKYENSKDDEDDTISNFYEGNIVYDINSIDKPLPKSDVYSRSQFWMKTVSNSFPTIDQIYQCLFDSVEGTLLTKNEKVALQFKRILQSTCEYHKKYSAEKITSSFQKYSEDVNSKSITSLKELKKELLTEFGVSVMIDKMSDFNINQMKVGEVAYWKSNPFTSTSFNTVNSSTVGLEDELLELRILRLIFFISSTLLKYVCRTDHPLEEYGYRILYDVVSFQTHHSERDQTFSKNLKKFGLELCEKMKFKGTLEFQTFHILLSSIKRTVSRYCQFALLDEYSVGCTLPGLRPCDFFEMDLKGDKTATNKYNDAGGSQINELRKMGENIINLTLTIDGLVEYFKQGEEPGTCKMPTNKPTDKRSDEEQRLDALFATNDLSDKKEGEQKEEDIQYEKGEAVKSTVEHVTEKADITKGNDQDLEKALSGGTEADTDLKQEFINEVRDDEKDSLIMLKEMFPKYEREFILFQLRDNDNDPNKVHHILAALHENEKEDTSATSALGDLNLEELGQVNLLHELLPGMEKELILYHLRQNNNDPNKAFDSLTAPRQVTPKPVGHLPKKETTNIWDKSKMDAEKIKELTNVSLNEASSYLLSNNGKFFETLVDIIINYHTDKNNKSDKLTSLPVTNDIPLGGRVQYGNGNNRVKCHISKVASTDMSTSNSENEYIFSPNSDEAIELRAIYIGNQEFRDNMSERFFEKALVFFKGDYMKVVEIALLMIESKSCDFQFRSPKQEPKINNLLNQFAEGMKWETTGTHHNVTPKKAVHSKSTGLKPNGGAIGTIDLHKLTVKEAVARINKDISAWWNYEIEERNQNGILTRYGSLAKHAAPLTIITGRGIHSTAGIPKIKIATEKWLNKNNFVFEDVTSGFVVTGRRKALK